MERSWRGEEEEDLLREWEVLPRECDMVYLGQCSSLVAVTIIVRFSSVSS